MHPRFCIRCGGPNLTAGRLRASGLAFILTAPRRLLRREPRVPVRARLCTDCGYIEMSGDVVEARRVMRRAQAESNPRSNAPLPAPPLPA